MLRFEGDLKARLAVKVAIIRHSKEDLRPSNVLRFSASSESAILTQHANSLSHSQQLSPASLLIIQICIILSTPPRCTLPPSKILHKHSQVHAIRSTQHTAHQYTFTRAKQMLLLSPREKATKDRRPLLCLDDHELPSIGGTRRYCTMALGVGAGRKGTPSRSSKRRCEKGRKRPKKRLAKMSPVWEEVYRSAGAGSKKTCRAIWGSVSTVIETCERGRYVQPMYPPHSRRYPR